MRLWDATKRILQGKPIFEAPQQNSQLDPSDPNAHYKEDMLPEEPGKRSVATSRRYNEKGEKILPRAEMTYCKCQKDHQTMQIWATIRNNSAVNIYLDKVALCSSEIAFNYPLAPGQQHDFMVYDGEKPTSPSACYGEVYYSDRGNGDSFVLQHMIAFRDDQDGTFSPTGFTPLMARGVQHSII